MSDGRHVISGGFPPTTVPLSYWVTSSVVETTREGTVKKQN